MDATIRIENALQAAIARAQGPGSPPRLAAALSHAVFPGGARVRPRLCLAVAAACGEDDPALTDAAAASIELLHCASLVHDDLPCFDDAAMRRGRASVHAAFGQPLAVLAGDALIVLAFQTMASAPCAPDRLPALLRTISRAVGMPSGIVAGQGWECEPLVDLGQYQRAKTAELFAAATVAGAVSAGASGEPWHLLGERLGEAYQVADDIRDASADADDLGKPTGRDAALGRPSAASALGLAGARKRLDALIAETLDVIPPCPGADELRALIVLEAKRFLRGKPAQRAA